MFGTSPGAASYASLIRLYPRAWRVRYEDEFLALLEDRPPTLLHLVDIVLGAIDARLSGEIPGELTDSEGEPRKVRTVNRLLAGAAAVGVGLSWTLAFVFGVVRSDDWAFFLLPIFLVLTLLALPGLHARQVGRSPALAWVGYAPAIAAAAIGLVVVMLMLGDVRLFGVSGWDVAFVVIALLFGSQALFGGVSAAIGSLPRGASLALAIGGAAQVVFHLGAMLLSGPVPGAYYAAGAIVTALYALGWVALGVALFQFERRSSESAVGRT